MDIIDYLRALRRRWRVIVIVTLIASSAAFLTAPSSSETRGDPVGTTYTATTTLLKAPEAQQVDLGLIRVYLRTGEIPKRVADKLDFPGVPAELAARLVVGGEDSVGTVTIATTAATAAEAEQITNTFAEVTIDYLGEFAETNQQRAIRVANRSVNSVTTELAEIDQEIKAEPEDSIRRAILEAKRDALLSQLQGLYGRLGELTGAATAPPLNILERAQAYAQLTGAPTLQAPSGRGPRLLLGLLLGLALGTAASLLIERLDTRLQGRESAENAFGLPVVAEIPHLSHRLRKAGQVVTAAVPESAAAESYRSLRAALLLMPSKILLGDSDGSGRRRRGAGGQVVLVTAPTARSGKTTTAVNLAVALAESGRRVLVVDADFRNPAVNRMLDVESSIGLTDVAVMGDAGRLDKVIQPSRVAPVHVLSAGSRSVPGSTIEAALPALIARARQLADVIVIDAAPLLSGSDALDVLPHVDTVVVVGRVRRTTGEQAQRARELLARIAVPVLGVALVGSRSRPIPTSGEATMLDRFGALRSARIKRPTPHRLPRRSSVGSGGKS